MLERYTTAERINEIINHPEIYPWIKGGNSGPLDLTFFAANPNNVCLVGKYGCVLFQKLQAGVYEFHTCVLPEGRGGWMLEQWKDVSRWMFTKTDAFELMTKCPDGNLASKAGAKSVGCSLVFRTSPIWPTDSGLVPVDVYSIILQHWIKQTPELAETGAFFHSKLEEKYRKLGKSEEIHPEDKVHDQYVGAAAEMLQNGQTQKAIATYNRWAIMAGYKPISVNYEPVIDIFEAKLRIKENDFDVIG